MATPDQGNQDGVGLRQRWVARTWNTGIDPNGVLLFIGGQSGELDALVIEVHAGQHQGWTALFPRLTGASK